MARDSTQAWSAVWQRGGNSSFDTFCVGTADGNVVPFLAEGTDGKGDGEDAMVPIFINGNGVILWNTVSRVKQSARVKETELFEWRKGSGSVNYLGRDGDTERLFSNPTD